MRRRIPWGGHPRLFLSVTASETIPSIRGALIRNATIRGFHPRTGSKDFSVPPFDNVHRLDVTEPDVAFLATNHGFGRVWRREILASVSPFYPNASADWGISVYLRRGIAEGAISKLVIGRT